MKKFIGAVLVILLAGPLWIFLTQENSTHAATESFFDKDKTDSASASATLSQNTIGPANSAAATAAPAKAVDTYILDRSTAPDKRRQLLQQLVAAGPVRLAEMAAIAQAPVPVFPKFRNPHSSDYGYYKFEKGLRITAIETLDQWAAKGTDVLKELMHIRDNQTEQDLVFLANLAVAGIQEGRPGKVTRFIDQAFDEALNGK